MSVAVGGSMTKSRLEQPDLAHATEAQGALCTKRDVFSVWQANQIFECLKFMINTTREGVCWSRVVETQCRNEERKQRH